MGSTLHMGTNGELIFGMGTRITSAPYATEEEAGAAYDREIENLGGPESVLIKKFPNQEEAEAAAVQTAAALPENVARHTGATARERG